MPDPNARSNPIFGGQPGGEQQQAQQQVDEQCADAERPRADQAANRVAAPVQAHADVEEEAPFRRQQGKIERRARKSAALPGRPAEGQKAQHGNGEQDAAQNEGVLPRPNQAARLLRSIFHAPQSRDARKGYKQGEIGTVERQTRLARVCWRWPIVRQMRGPWSTRKAPIFALGCSSSRPTT